MLITSANAAEMGRKGVIERKNKTIEREAERKALITAVAALTPPKLPAPPKQPNADPATAQADKYLRRRLKRVRKQIDRVSDMLDEEEDPQKLDRLAAALERLCELERVMAGRALPGSLRPAPKPKSPQSSGLAAPVGPAPSEG